MNSFYSKIPNFFLEKALKESPVKTIAQTMTLIYKDQVPNVAIVLKRGAVVLGERRLVIKNKKETCLICFSELINGQVCTENITVEKGSEVIIIDKVLAQQLGDLDEAS